MAFTPITLTGHYLLENNQPAAGHVDIVLTGTIKDTTDKIVVVPTKVTATLDSGGHFSVTILATDDTTTSPQNVPYKITEVINGATVSTYQILVPAASTAGTLDIADAQQVTTQGAQYYLLPLVGSSVPADTTPGTGGAGASKVASRDDHSHHIGLHAVTHHTGGTDVLAPVDIGAATQADLTTLQTTVAAKADQTSLDTTNTTVATKADQTSLTTTNTNVTNLTTTVGTKQTAFTTVAETASFTALANKVHKVDSTAGAVTVTLPAAAEGLQFVIKRTDASANAVTISATVDGTVSPTLARWDTWHIYSDGTNWYRL